MCLALSTESEPGKGALHGESSKAEWRLSGLLACYFLVLQTLSWGDSAGLCLDGYRDREPWCSLLGFPPPVFYLVQRGCDRNTLSDHACSLGKSNKALQTTIMNNHTKSG